jgi:hypothetical protein
MQRLIHVPSLLRIDSSFFEFLGKFDIRTRTQKNKTLRRLAVMNYAHATTRIIHRYGNAQCRRYVCMLLDYLPKPNVCRQRCLHLSVRKRFFPEALKKANFLLVRSREFWDQKAADVSKTPQNIKTSSALQLQLSTHGPTQLDIGTEI